MAKLKHKFNTHLNSISSKESKIAEKMYQIRVKEDDLAQ